MEGDISAEVEAQGERLGLPPNFYVGLIKEDDWSFVIKLNALVEAACGDALAARFHEPGLAASLATLEIGHPKHGKVALLLTLGALEKEQADVLKILYELRNKLAHNISQVAFSFDEYFAALDGNQKKSFIKRVGHGIKPNVKGVSRELFVAQNPKIALWITVSEILACLHLEHEAAHLRLQRLALGMPRGEEPPG